MILRVSVLDQTQLLEGISAESTFPLTIDLAEYVDKIEHFQIW